MFSVSNLIKVFLGVISIAIAAQLSISVSNSMVPISAQTIPVLLVGYFLGTKRAFVCLCLYIMLGALGLPVFAEGNSGVAHVFGSSAGYLIGFVIAASFVGWVFANYRQESFGFSFVIFALAHSSILIFGVVWLSRQTGFAAAIETGVLPFLFGMVIKSLIAATVVKLHKAAFID